MDPDELQQNIDLSMELRIRRGLRTSGKLLYPSYSSEWQINGAPKRAGTDNHLPRRVRINPEPLSAASTHVHGHAPVR